MPKESQSPVLFSENGRKFVDWVEAIPENEEEPVAILEKATELKVEYQNGGHEVGTVGELLSGDYVVHSIPSQVCTFVENADADSIRDSIKLMCEEGSAGSRTPYMQAFLIKEYL